MKDKLTIHKNWFSINGVKNPFNVSKIKIDHKPRNLFVATLECPFDEIEFKKEEAPVRCNCAEMTKNLPSNKELSSLMEFICPIHGYQRVGKNEQ